MTAPVRARIYHNPRCSKSRGALLLLEERGVDVEVVRYLEHPPEVGELREICARIGLSPRDLVRRKEPRFGELGLDSRDLSDEEWLETLAANPVLIERPLVLIGRRGVIRRPPENVLSIL